jgi:succinoglycan biosynthesis protein ExoV
VKLYYYRTGVRNFGDDLNQWLWPKLIPELLDPTDGYLFVGIGTILNQRIPELPQKVVFGAGVGYGATPVLDDSWTVYCVRGPLTAAALQLSPDMAITDPAILVSTLDDLPPATTSDRIGFMPHFETSIRAELDGLSLPAVCADADMTLIDSRREVDEVLAAIRGCELVIAEAMHGAIIADALRVPWIPVRCYDHILDFKWRDWCESLQLQYEPAILDPQQLSSPSWTTFLKSASSARPVMSSDAVARTTIERLQQRLEVLRHDHASSHHAREREPSATASAIEQSTADVRLWWKNIHEAGKGIDSVVPPEDLVIFVDEDQWRNQLSSGRRLVPFLEREGQYWGPPADSETAIQELDRLRGVGARFIIFAQPAFWWLEYYARLTGHLRSHFPCSLENEQLVVFDLRS